MAIKRIWAMPPRRFKTSTGKEVLVGVTTIFNTGKVYKGTGKRDRERAQKRMKKNVTHATSD